MNFDIDRLFDNFVFAAQDALIAPEYELFDSRYGLSGQSPAMYKKIFSKYGLSDSITKKVLNNVMGKIIFKSIEQLNGRRYNEPCSNYILLLLDLVFSYDASFTDSFKKSLAQKSARLYTGLNEFLSSQRSIIELTVDDDTYIRNNYCGLLDYITIKMFADKRVKSIHEGLLSECRRLILLLRDVEKISNVVIASTSTKVTKEDKHPISLRRLLDSAKWTTPIKKMKYKDIFGLRREREIVFSPDKQAGSFPSEKMCRNVIYESVLEKNFYKLLEQSDDVMLYQEQPVKIPYEKLGKNSWYHPDVMVVLDDYRAIIVEIKSVNDIDLDNNLDKLHSLKRYCTTKGYGMLVTDGNSAESNVQSYQKYLEKCLSGS